MNVFVRVEAYVLRKQRDENVLVASEGWDRDGLAFEFDRRADAVIGHDFDATAVGPGQDDDRRPGVNVCDVMRGKRETDIDLTRKKHLGRPERCLARVLDVSDVGEALGRQEVVSDVVWRDA